MEYDIIVVGAGASGLVAAIAAAAQGAKVLMIEYKDKAGKKILATGNGKCNYTNLIQTPECYRSEDSAHAMEVLSHFDFQNTLDFFKQLGIMPKDRSGYIYPNSEQASSILQVLLMECDRLGVTIQYNEKVTSIELRKEKPGYTLRTKPVILPEEDKTYRSDRVILASGGCASPKLGSDGSGYALAKALGHRIIKPLPALVQLKASDKYCRTVSGVRTGAKVTLYQEDKSKDKLVELACEQGEIIFTDYGISGIPVMQISRFAAKALDQGRKVTLLLDFFPEYSLEELRKIINQRIHFSRGKNLEEMMIGFLNHKLNYVLLNEGRLNPKDSCHKIKPEETDRLVSQLKGLKMTIKDTNGFDNAQVSAGGVPLSEINRKTMESNYTRGIYLAGELLDVDGTCGGYNLQWAWTTGYLAGSAAGQNTGKDKK